MNRFTFLFLLTQAFPFSAFCQSMSNGGSGTGVYPHGRPADFPTPPKTDRSLFFIQRNKNKNTVVYDAHLTKEGKIHSNKPVDVYWLRYSGSGERSELTWLQRTFAFGYGSKKESKKESFWITLTAYDGRKIHLEKTSDGLPIATMTINGKYCQLYNIWVYADETGNWPKVLHVDLHGKNMVTGKPEFERIYNK
jgi:hypothetical protein